MEEKGEKYDLEPLKNHAKDHTAHKTVKLFFHMYSIIGHDIENVWNLQLVLFHLKSTNVNFSIYVWENTYLHTGINIPFYLFIIFVGLGTKCKILNFCFLVFLTMLFLHLSLAPMDSAEVMDFHCI